MRIMDEKQNKLVAIRATREFVQPGKLFEKGKTYMVEPDDAKRFVSNELAVEVPQAAEAAAAEMSAPMPAKLPKGQ
jgi:hypothetical protein